jgi:signal transduction histidine kinase
VLAINSAVTHDLRNPLALLKSYIYVFKYYKTDDPKIKELIEKMDFAVNNSAEIVDSFLPLLKEDHKIVLKYIKISDIVKTTALSPGHNNLPIDMVVHLKKNFLIKADELMMKQVLTNLINNAIEAMTKSVHRKIHIKTFISNKKAMLTIKDTGCGIKVGDIEKIFDPFFSKKDSGYGIGLAFCKYTLDKMGVSIKCKSVWKKGTEFQLIFPVHKLIKSNV